VGHSLDDVGGHSLDDVGALTDDVGVTHSMVVEVVEHSLVVVEHSLVVVVEEARLQMAYHHYSLLVMEKNCFLVYLVVLLTGKSEAKRFSAVRLRLSASLFCRACSLSYSVSPSDF
jgi:hypothetical protein